MRGSQVMVSDHFYVPNTKVVTLVSGKRHAIVGGIRKSAEIPSELLDTPLGLKHGIKPVTEMIDAEWALSGTTREEFAKQFEPAYDSESHKEVEQDTGDGGGSREDK